MIGTVLALLSAFGCGVILASALMPESGVRIVAGTGFLLGLALPASALFLLSIVGVPWSLPAAGIISLAVVGMVFLIRRRLPPAVSQSRDAHHSIAAILIDLLSVVLVLGYVTFSTNGPVIEYDFIGIWGVKAWTFFLHGGIDWKFLEHPWRAFTHADYPILLPLTFDYLALARGAWDDRWIGLLFAGYGAASLLVARGALEEESGSQVFSALGTFALISAALSPYIGLAEGPLIAYGGVGIILIRRAIALEDSSGLTTGALLLGLAASTKNEGMTLVVAAILGVVAAIGFDRRLVRLWPAIVIPLPWVLLRSVHSLHNDLATGSVLSRIWLHLHEPGLFLRSITRYPLGRPLFWVGLLLVFLVALPPALKRERFALTTIAIQYLFYVFAYLSTPHGVDWHFKWSWERVISQMTFPLGFVVIAMTIPFLFPKGEAGSPP
ncbi:MAG: hypothetical protein ABI718_10065 [Acidobacteriota bacterium]